MAYTALYRNFRPLKFSDMVGQEHITRTLRNQITSGRVGHAYLFNGGRGTGKTTSAKILARVVNCINPQDGEPCNECEICEAILNNALTDVVEMDAASNNGVEDIRSIRDEVNFLPTKAKYRVYIIDEVHMLSIGAFNALLKTLEEPPEHVKFILATTEPQKIPTTILSRCQRFDFKKISEDDIVKRLKIICEESNIKIEEDALKLIAVLSEGAMRDGISILERCNQENLEKIKIEDIKELVGIPSLTYISKITRAMLEYNEQDALSVIDEILNEGKDLTNFLWEIIKYVKDVLVYSSTGKLKIYSEEEIKTIDELSKIDSKERLLDMIYKLSELENDMKKTNQKTIMFQVGIIKLCTKGATSGDFKILDEKINALAQKIMTISNNRPIINEQPREVVREMPVSRPVQKTQENIPQANPKTVSGTGKIDEKWKNVLDLLRKTGKISLYTNLINTKAVEINDMVIEIEFPNGLTPFGKGVLEKPENKNELVKIISQEMGKSMQVRYKDSKEVKKVSQNSNGMGDLGIDINFIDE